MNAFSGKVRKDKREEPARRLAGAYNREKEKGKGREGN